MTRRKTIDTFKKDTEHAERKRKAVDLRTAGATYRDIAHHLGISLGGAHDLVQEAAIEVPAEDVALMRQRESERLDALQRAQWPKAVKGDAEAARVALSIIDRRIRLYGLDAPQQVEIGVGSVDIAGTARNILAQVMGDIDAEVVEERGEEPADG